MTQRNRRRQRRRGGIGSKLLIGFGGVFVLVVIAVIAVTSWVLDVAADAPSLATCKPIDRGGNSTLYAADGSKLGVIASDEARTPVSIKRIPKTVQLATVAIEDQRFYQHGGVDPEGILRAARQGPRSRRSRSRAARRSPSSWSATSASATRSRTSNARSSRRSWRSSTPKRHSRQEILGQYLNIASYGTIEGSTAVGVQAASKIFFSKPVWKLTLPQAALLAGLPQAPSEYNPILNPGEALAAPQRGAGEDGEARLRLPRARQSGGGGAAWSCDVSDSYFKHRQPYFFDYVENKLIEKYGVDTVRNGGLEVHTTIDPGLQQVGLDAMRSPCPTRPTPPRRWSRSTPATATSGRWSPAPTTPAASSTSPPRATASRARPSRPSS